MSASPRSAVSPGSPSSSSESEAKTPSRQHTCATCDKTFSSSGQLSRHNRIHKGIKKFQCDVEGCSKTFFRADNRTQHSVAHQRRVQKHAIRQKQALALRNNRSDGIGPALPPHRQPIHAAHPPVSSNVRIQEGHMNLPQQYIPSSLVAAVIPSQSIPLTPRHHHYHESPPHYNYYEQQWYHQPYYSTPSIVSKTSIQFLCD
ncbi:hypothetical protein BDR26DRAFT_914793 [Obelidium mucronatum]|nr:hypothetical protein BDR26DRAFT_914793 [Obelidium mucronatum]